MSIGIALPPLATQPLCIMRVAVDAVLSVGGPPGLGRRVGSIPGGALDGKRLRGTIVPGGTDWQTERGDGAILLDARIVVRTHDDALVAITYTGIRHGPPDVIARLGRGDTVDPGEYYFRIVPSFATSDPRYEWLNRIVAVGVGHRAPEGPIYQIYEIV
jgi:Protein of unknown function (DUF3237)